MGVGDPLLDSGPYQPHWTRFIVLFSFCYNSMLQAAAGNTLGPIQDEVQIYYNISADTVELLSNWNAIAYLPFLPVAMYLAKRKGGLRTVTLVATWLTFIATTIRLIPSVFPGTFLDSHGGCKACGMAVIHTSQILCSAGGPMVMATISQLSQTWFGEDERTSATAVAFVTNNMGIALTYLLSPGIAGERPDRIPLLLYIFGVLGLLDLVLILSYFPAAPPAPPSLAAWQRSSIEDGVPVAAEEGDVRLKRVTGSLVDPPPPEPYLVTLWKAIKNPNFLILAVCGGLFNGAFNGWSALLDFIMAPLGYNDDTVGWLGFVCIVGSMAGGLAGGRIADRWFQKRLKRLILIFLACCLASFVLFTACLPSDIWNEPLVDAPQSWLFVLIALGGFFVAACGPLIYELSVELSFPLPETTAVGIITLFDDLGGFGLFTIPTEYAGVMNLTMACVVLVTLCGTMAVTESYARA